MIGKTQHGKVFRRLQLGCVALLFNAVVTLASNQPGAEAATPVKLVAFGDSLTAGYALTPAWRLEARWDNGFDRDDERAEFGLGAVQLLDQTCRIAA